MPALERGLYGNRRAFNRSPVLIADNAGENAGTAGKRAQPKSRRHCHH
jgi:hypothetical protein